MNDHLKKTMDAAKQILQACKTDPKLADELAKSLEKKQGVPKGVDPDKMERCVTDVDKKGSAQNKYAVCAASLQGETHKAEHQPHPGPSKPEHQKQYDAKQQAEHEKRLKTPEGESERKKRNEKMREMFKADDEKFMSKLRKDPPSEGTGLPKPESTHETPEDRKEKKVSLTKEELRECMKADDDMMKTHIGFDKLQHKIASKEDISQERAAKITAAIGQKKYGKAGMAHKAAAAKKAEENPDKDADAKLGEKVEHDVEQHMKENASAEREEGHEMAKALTPPGKGVHAPFEIQSNFPRKRGGFQDVKGISGMGHDVRNARSLRSTYLQNPAQRPALIASSQAAARNSAKHHLAEQRSMPKPKLPK